MIKVEHSELRRIWAIGRRNILELVNESFLDNKEIGEKMHKLLEEYFDGLYTSVFHDEISNWNEFHKLLKTILKQSKFIWNYVNGAIFNSFKNHDGKLIGLMFPLIRHLFSDGFLLYNSTFSDAKLKEKNTEKAVDQLFESCLSLDLLLNAEKLQVKVLVKHIDNEDVIKKLDKGDIDLFQGMIHELEENLIKALRFLENQDKEAKNGRN